MALQTGRTGNNFIKTTIALALLGAASPAWSFYNDRIEVFVAETATWDSNVFRLSRNLVPQTLLGTSNLGDRILTTSVGVNADIPMSLQRFQGSYQRFWTRYNRFNQLDFDGDLWRVAWLWAVTSELTGDVGYDEATGLASFATFRGTTPDVIHTRHAFASANWQMNARWLAYAGLNGIERKHEDPARRVNDLVAKVAEARVSYVTPRENRVGVALRYEDGGAPETRLFQGIPFDNAYTQVGLGVVGRWELSPHSRFDGRVDYIKRKYDQFTQRNYSGPAWGFTYTWLPSPKFTMPVTVRRDIAPLEDVQTTFVLATGVSIKPRWQMSEKVALVGSADYSRWKYHGDPIVGGDFEHNVRAASVGFAWTPFQRVVITGAVSREARTSNLVNADYQTTITTLDAKVGF